MNQSLSDLSREVADTQTRGFVAHVFNILEAAENYDRAVIRDLSTIDGKPTAEILLVDDSPQYARLIQEAFREVNAHVHFHMASDGVEALIFLRHPGTANPRPDLILLDIAMPKMDGREVLAKLKEDDNLKTIPTLILTSSDMQDDIGAAYKLHANAYLHKPLQLDQLVVLVKSINDFWFAQSKVPEAAAEMNLAGMFRGDSVFRADAGSLAAERHR